MEWEEIPGYAGYFANRDGRIASTKRSRFLVLTSRSCYQTDHQRVRLYLDGKRIPVLVHRLILETFVGPCPPGMECRHLDGDPTNNRVENLAWGTPKQNAEDRDRHGTQRRGNQTPFTDLDDSTVSEIRRLYREGTKGPELCTRFGLTRACLYNMVSGRSWKHIRGEGIDPLRKGRGEILITAFGETKSLRLWISDPRCTVSLNALRHRLAIGMSPEDAIARGKHAFHEAFGEFKRLEDWVKDSRCRMSLSGLLKRIARGMDLETAMTTPSWFEGRGKNASFPVSALDGDLDRG